MTDSTDNPMPTYFTDDELSIHTLIEGAQEVAEDQGEDVSFFSTMFDESLKAKPAFTGEQLQYLHEQVSDYDDHDLETAKCQTLKKLAALRR